MASAYVHAHMRCFSKSRKHEPFNRRQNSTPSTPPPTLLPVPPESNVDKMHELSQKSNQPLLVDEQGTLREKCHLAASLMN